MSIEFGVLRDGSTITLIGEYRVQLPEELLPELEPFLRRVEAATGQELDVYGSAVFAGQALIALIAELEAVHRSTHPASPSAQAFISQLLRVASFAKGAGKALSYFGE